MVLVDVGSGQKGEGVVLSSLIAWAFQSMICEVQVNLACDAAFNGRYPLEGRPEHQTGFIFKKPHDCSLGADFLTISPVEFGKPWCVAAG